MIYFVTAQYVDYLDSKDLVQKIEEGDPRFASMFIFVFTFHLSNQRADNRAYMQCSNQKQMGLEY